MKNNAKFKIYTTNITSGQTGLLVKANTSITDSFNIIDNADFYATYILGRESIKNQLLLQIRINQINYFDKPTLLTPFLANIGENNFGIIFKVPLIFNHSDKVQLDFTNLSSNDIIVNIIFLGYELPYPRLKK